jgi:biotin carboxyl carrier protein
MTYDVFIDGKQYRLELEQADGQWDCRLDGRAVTLDAVITRQNVLSLLMDGKSYEIKREISATDLHLWVGSTRYAAEIRDPRSLRSRRAEAESADGVKKILAPMPGKVVRILAREGTEVQAGQGVIVVEAMKMQNELKSPKQGTVQKVEVAEGAAVNAGDVLMIVE